jgi:hypothetical protein
VRVDADQSDGAGSGQQASLRSGSGRCGGDESSEGV